jgi:hypothetical protein
MVAHEEFVKIYNSGLPLIGVSPNADGKIFKLNPALGKMMLSQQFPTFLVLGIAGVVGLFFYWPVGIGLLILSFISSNNTSKRNKAMMVKAAVQSEEIYEFLCREGLLEVRSLD